MRGFTERISRVQRGISPHRMTARWFSPDLTMTGISLDGATLNRERAPIIGSKTRKRLPRSSIQMSEYLPHMDIVLWQGGISSCRTRGDGGFVDLKRSFGIFAPGKSFIS
jgi:hypothetical protein